MFLYFINFKLNIFWKECFIYFFLILFIEYILIVFKFLWEIIMFDLICCVLRKNNFKYRILGIFIMYLILLFLFESLWIL